MIWFVIGKAKVCKIQTLEKLGWFDSNSEAGAFSVNRMELQHSFQNKISAGPVCLNIPSKFIVTFNSHTCPMDKQLKWRYLRFHTQCLELLPRVKWWRIEFSSWCNIFGKILLLAQLRSTWEYFSLFRNGQSRVWGPLRWHYMQKANLTLLTKLWKRKKK